MRILNGILDEVPAGKEPKRFIVYRYPSACGKGPWPTGSVMVCLPEAFNGREL
jgi:hypothetical protein